MKQSLSIIVVIIFLTGTVGFNLSTHFCGGKISDQSIGISAADLSCGMENESTNSCASEGQEVRDACCDNSLQSFLITDEFKTQTEQIDLKKPYSLAFTLVYFDLVPFETPLFSNKRNFNPPPLIRDIPVYIQSFLI